MNMDEPIRQPDLVLHHVMIAVPAGSEPIASHFYGDVLGLSEITKPATLASRRGLWFSLGELELHLGVDTAFSPARKAHIALLVGDLDAIGARLDSVGIPFNSDETMPGYRRFYVDDPFGNRLEFLERNADQGVAT